MTTPSLPLLRAGNETHTVAQLGRAMADLHGYLGQVETAYANRCKEYEELQQFAERATVERDQAQEQLNLTRSVVESQRTRIQDLEAEITRLQGLLEKGTALQSQQATQLTSLHRRLVRARTLRKAQG
jgi:hypothetical protein